ncbi:3-phytase a precursor [Malassezia pachydermatis]|uniref:3-phytase a n=1 Tax=Malassezia pachydermatis TaxID=77020 RepID=A0A0M9VQ74_9BASI|nr:3-phytase a precursor [Malassezia pachydermatis]KOS15215.1 3-phytase a precursor [Malassezia pachydermatis]
MAKIALLLSLVLAAVSHAQNASQTSWNNVTGTSNTPFPTDVGFAGPVAYGIPPLRSQVDKLNSTEFQGNNYGVEMRWIPKDADKDHATSDDIFRNLGTTSPYHVADDLFPETNAYRTMPDQCEIKQVHILHRHGARYPTSSSHEATSVFGAAVSNATKAGTLDATGDMAFLNSWNFSIGVEVLVHQGAQELFDSGTKHYYDYARLLQNYTDKLVLRTTSESRMLDTARYWMLGFFGWDAPSRANLEVLTEADKQNNTLASWFGCPNMNLDSFYIEWENYEYDIDLQFQGDYGFMNPAGKAQGVGWVVEFLDRLTKSQFKGPVTGQNTTLDGNTTYFPSMQPLYADFTHDDIIHSVLTSLNVTQISDFLPTTKPDPKRRYRSSRVTPFAARLVWEVMDCQENNATTSYIRGKINEAVIPLNQDQGCSPRPDGLCKLQDFVSHQQESAVRDAKFDLVCFGQNGTDFTVTGPVRNGTI